MLQPAQSCTLVKEHTPALKCDDAPVPANLKRVRPPIRRWTAIAGYVDRCGKVVGFLLEAGDGTQASLDLAEPEGDIRVLTVTQLKAEDAAGLLQAG